MVRVGYKVDVIGDWDDKLQSNFNMAW
jgi:hypothetical protein